jgi:hypothetical protein
MNLREEKWLKYDTQNARLKWYTSYRVGNDVVLVVDLISFLIVFR